MDIFDLPAFIIQKRNPPFREDFSYITHRIPSTILSLAAGLEQNEKNYPLHHPGVKFQEEALIYGSAVYAYIALKWLEENV